ncbi:TRAM domain-containing protein, partial [Candidatus Woesearchaeota archaeon]|nr:TRAM domain-containing protein [Candidatus Woesearchaeota archaeon]
MNEQAPPVKTGDIVEVSIESVGGKGDGIARVRGFVLFVPNVKKGDYVKIKVTKVLPKMGFAEFVEKLEAKPKEQKYATFSREEIAHEEKQQQPQYEDSE